MVCACSLKFSGSFDSFSRLVEYQYAEGKKDVNQWRGRREMQDSSRIGMEGTYL